MTPVRPGIKVITGESLKKQDFPDIKVMATGLLKVAADTVVNGVQGEPILATEELVQTRLSICQACEFFSSENSRCTKCGCFMLAKTKLQVSKCPVNKW